MLTVIKNVLPGMFCQWYFELKNFDKSFRIADGSLQNHSKRKLDVSIPKAFFNLIKFVQLENLYYDDSVYESTYIYV